MDGLPDRFVRYPTGRGRADLAARLGLSIDRFSQDWEWEVAEPGQFATWLAVYRHGDLSDDERFSLMEMLVQCVEEMVRDNGPPGRLEEFPAWRAVADLLRARPQLHASTVAYWSVFGQDDPDGQFRVSSPMRRVWADIQHRLRS